jgi:hypothetical protein
VVFGAVPLGHQPGVRQFVELPVVEPDRKRLDRAARQSAHDGDYDARINAPAEHGAEWNVCQLAQPDRFG